MFFGNMILILLIAAGLAFIPANLAKKKGYNFGLWWLYGWALFIVAIIHISLLPDKREQAAAAEQGAADELGKYKVLYDQGVLTEEEFQAKKERLLNLSSASPSDKAVGSETLTAGELKKYKDLLVQGAITEEEFQLKKMELLHLMPAEEAKPAEPSEPPAVEELKMYKELFDHGVLTEEEFQEKKRKLLASM